MSQLNETNDAGLFTIPNLISFVRISIALVVLALLIWTHMYLLTAIILAIGGVTDFLDGYVARHTNQVSNIGKAIDPVADRVLLIGSGVGVIAAHLIPLIIITVIMVREIVMSVATISLAILKARRIDVVWVGKAGTFALMVCVPLFLIGFHFPGSSFPLWKEIFYYLGIGVSIPAIVLSWIATITYIPKAFNAYKMRASNLK